MGAKRSGDIRFITIRDIDDFEIVCGKSVANAFPAHVHQKYCIGVIEKGSTVFVHGNAVMLLKAGDVYFIGPGEAHQIKPAAAEGFDHIVLCFGLRFCENYFFEAESGNAGFSFNTSTVFSPTACSRFRAFVKLISGKNSSGIVEYALMALLSEIYPFCSVKGPEFNEASRPACISEVCAFITENCKRSLSLDELASKACLSKFHFSRVFKSAVGITPYDFQIQAKLKLARRMLLQNQPVAAVAMEFGFSDQSHFTRFFKRHMGVTPAQFKKMNMVVSR